MSRCINITAIRDLLYSPHQSYFVLSTMNRDATHAIAENTFAVTIQRSMGMFGNEAPRQPVPGCHLAISGSFAEAHGSGDAAEHLSCSLAIWMEKFAEYNAEGRDGMRFAFCKYRMTCFSGVDGMEDATGSRRFPENIGTGLSCSVQAQFRMNRGGVERSRWSREPAPPHSGKTISSRQAAPLHRTHKHRRRAPVERICLCFQQSPISITNIGWFSLFRLYSCRSSDYFCSSGNSATLTLIAVSPY